MPATIPARAISPTPHSKPDRSDTRRSSNARKSTWRDALAVGLVACWVAACGPAKAAPSAAIAPTEAAVASTPRPQTEPSVHQSAPRSARELPAAEAADAPTPTPVVSAAPTDPLPPEQHAIFFSSAEDEPAEVRGGLTTELVDKHYLAGNEKSLTAFYPVIRGIGGGYVGVGSDQAYLLIGWAKPQVAWFIDYDADVIRMHKVYRALLLAVDTPTEFLALWDKDGRAEAREIIEEAYAGPEAVKLRSLYGEHRGWIHRRLRGLARHLAEADVPGFLTDQQQYAYVQEMLRSERIRPMVTNLLDRRGVTGIGDAARQLGVPIRVLYLSNAEQYWNGYTKRYRHNVASLPFDDHSVVLRTLLVWHVNQDYRYNAQPAVNYVQWLEHPSIRHVNDITHAGPEAKRGVINFFETDGDPDASPAHRRAQKRAAQAAR